MAREETEDAIIAYKSILAQIIDNRPSGTRQRLATELGKHRSFVSQITNPIYPIPVPARHLETIFRICHLAPEERHAFMAAYEAARNEEELAAALAKNLWRGAGHEGPARALAAYAATARQHLAASLPEALDFGPLPPI